MAKPKVLISDELSPRAVEILSERGCDVDFKPGLKPAELRAIIGNYEGLAIRSATKVTAEVLAEAKKLRVVGRAGIGVDNVDIKAATAHGVVVMNTPFGNAITTAEHAIALMFAVARQVPDANTSTQAGKWEKNRFMGTELSFKTLGLIGCGNIGSIVAERALGLKMRVLAFDPFPAVEWAQQHGVEYTDPRTIASECEVISLHTPLTPDTHHIVCRETLELVKPGAILINVSRGALIDTKALIEALKSGRLGGVALDVYEEEEGVFFEDLSGQILHDDELARLLTFPNVLITAHQAFLTQEALAEIARVTVANLSAFASGEPFLPDTSLANGTN